MSGRLCGTPDSATSSLPGLVAAIAACKAAVVPARALDAQIAAAVFPALVELHSIDAGIWRSRDGTRIRALLYSRSRAAAATLVPPGCWIEADERGTVVAGAAGEWVGAHPVAPIALCIAALDARLAEAAHAR
jgi:hypothetical protein